ncbi:MAG: CapA family protein [Bacteroidota bacterium]
MKNKILLLIPIGLFLIVSGINDIHRVTAPFPDTSGVKKITLSFVGDIMCHTPQLDYARIDSDSFDFKPVFREVKKYLSESDLTFGNLETVIGGSKFKFTGYPLFNSPIELLEALNDSGFDILFTSNNHSLDKGVDGIFNTINNISNYGMKAEGTYTSETGKDSLTIFEVGGFKLGILSYTYGLNGNFLSKKFLYAVNLIDTTQIKYNLQKCKLLDTDINIIYFHFGEEYSHRPSKYQEEIVEKTFSYGADIIVASHPHVVQPIRYYKKQNGNLDRGIVAYSLGNFISNQRWRFSDAGLILNIELSKDIKDSVWISDVSIIPTWVYKGNTGIKNEFVIVPSDTLLHPIPKYILPSDKSKLLQSYNDVLSKYELKNKSD